MMVSYFEVYNETIVDLLNRSNTGLEIRGSTKDGFYVDNLTEIPVENAEKAMEVYTKGENERTYASTNMNSNSSRSHVILKLSIETRYMHAIRSYKSNLVLVDLAGSEGLAHSKTQGRNQREGRMIN